MPGFQLVDVTKPPAFNFSITAAPTVASCFPKRSGSGCAFLDYDADGWQDILLVNGADWPGHHRERSTLRLYRNNRNGTFSDVTKQAGLDIEMYGMGVSVGDYNNDGFPDIYITCVGQNRLFRNTGKGTFVDVTRASGLAGHQAFSTSAVWFDFDRDGRLDLFVCNYVRWSLDHDVFCSLDGKAKSYCTPEAYRGETCWLFHNKGDGTFEDITAKSGIFDSSSKSLGVALLDSDRDGWLDLVVANDTQPNKLYRNQRNGTFKDVAVEAGLAFSVEGKARAGMGVDTGDYDNSGTNSVAITNFDNEMIGLYHPQPEMAPTKMSRCAQASAWLRSQPWASDARSPISISMARSTWSSPTVTSTTRCATSAAMSDTRSRRSCFSITGREVFGKPQPRLAPDFGRPKVGRGLAYGDFDRDGDLDLLVTTNNGPAFLYRNDQTAGNRSIRFKLVGTKSNRDGIGATVVVEYNKVSHSQMVKSGSSYLSQSEMPLTFGMGKYDRVDRAVIYWPSGQTEEFKNLAAGRAV